MLVQAVTINAHVATLNQWQGACDECFACLPPTSARHSTGASLATPVYVWSDAKSNVAASGTCKPPDETGPEKADARRCCAQSSAIQ